MKFSTIVAPAVLLLLPALVSTAPTASPAELVTRIITSDPLKLFTRQAPGDDQTCNEPKPVATGDKEKDAAATKKYNDLKKKMADATKAAHADQKVCPMKDLIDFNKSKNTKTKTAKKEKCVKAWNACVTHRKAANTACTQLGGTVDWGHSNAVTVCQSNAQKWSNANA